MTRPILFASLLLVVGLISKSVSAAPRATCESKLRVHAGDSFSQISRQCYGSRTYADWLTLHNHHQHRPLKADETLDIPSFETLVRERVDRKWLNEVGAIAEAFEHFRKAEDEIEAQLRKAHPGVASYQPSPHAKAELEKATRSLQPVVLHLKAAGVHTKKFAGARDALSALASGRGSFSTDYATEEIHQSFSYGVDALTRARP